MRWVFLLSLGLLLAAGPAPAASPSFDCGKATSSAEELVCSDDQLAALDRELARLFKLALGGRYMDDQRLKELKAYQRGWIKGRDECWKADDQRLCVRDSYMVRMIELRQGYAGARSEDDAGISRGPFVLACPEFQAAVGLIFVASEPPLTTLQWLGRSVVLEQTQAASGARYRGSSSDGDYELWIKGEEARFGRAGFETRSCLVEEVG